MIRWRTERVEESDATWRDRVSTCGRFRIEAGHGAAWALHERRGGRMRWASDHATIEDAQGAAGVLVEREQAGAPHEVSIAS